MMRRFHRAGLAACAGLLLASAAARAGDAELLAGAADRIEKNRKADAVLVVQDTAGKPVPGAKVAVAQTKHAFLFGCNIFNWGSLRDPADEAAYRDRFAAVFNYATLPFYWPGYEPRQGQPAHANREAIARWCREHGITPKGHPLAWNFADPRWLPDDPEEIRTLQMARIEDCVGRFKGLIDIWDIVNEATHYERDEFRKSAPRMTGMIDHVGREEFILDCIRHARNANPSATLLLNDYRTDPAFAELIKRVIEKSGGKPPFDIIGIQSHQHGGTWSNTQIWEVCERYAAFGLPLHFTETTILSGERGFERQGAWPSTPEGEAKQADEVERFYTMVFSHPAVAAITWWDFADRNAWQNAPAGFLRKDLSPKPAYDRLHKLIKERWWTCADLTADARGEARLRAFLGDHKVTVQADGRQTTATLTVHPGENRLVVTLP
jgi:GH35 family endo-1,4-beta-xylanase